MFAPSIVLVLVVVVVLVIARSITLGGLAISPSLLRLFFSAISASPRATLPFVKLSSCVTRFVTSVTGFVTPYRVNDRIV
jgi:hypothetical protein